MDEVNLLRVAAAFVFVIGLIFLSSWLLRYFRGSAWAEKMQGERRLQLVEQLYIDSRTKLVLVKCDAVEHLLLVGAQGSQVVAEAVKGKKK